MTDFFTQLERELSAAADRPPRRFAGWPGRGLAVAVALIAFAAALVPAVVILGSGDEPAPTAEDPVVPTVGTVIRKGEGPLPNDVDSTVVATGHTKIGGRWQIESYRGKGIKDPETGEEYEPAGLRCLRLVTTDPPSAGGQCGEFPKTPGFSQIQTTIPARRVGEPLDPKTTAILVYGRVPDEALGVDLRIPGRLPERYRTFEGPPGDRSDYYLFAVRPDVKNARVEWIGPGRVGRRDSIALSPP